MTYHAPGKFDAITGERVKKDASGLPPKYQDVFGHTLVELAKNNPKIVGITPAMPTGSSLRYMMEEIPERAFDVGLAEQHAVPMAAGMASEGLIPFCNIYSTFLQRAYDQLIHDVALQNLPVIFCLDRAGLVGQDGPTHHGVFDIAYLRCIPNMTIFAPMDEMDLRNMMYTAQKELKGPLAIRYPRGRGSNVDWKAPFEAITLGKGRHLKKGSHNAILTMGHIGNAVSEMLEAHPEKEKIAHFDMRFAKPLDTSLLHEIMETHEQIITVEDGCKVGGLGSGILEFNMLHKYTNRIKVVGIPDTFIEQGTIPETHILSGIDIDSIRNYINGIL